ncbi:hypothetical protein TrVE_jg13559 [Triparma verrucosa]|uniref:Uncharacterized protein n=2 Tax=Triparma TaxID=722752 RepID=A0A9W7ERJ9_9STRA|nr:hypothetical protein TrST_g6228 [Triparma strigata]GMI12906.1 hypothetical protein TrVE_jg13559 [Triparma verrucosa]
MNSYISLLFLAFLAFIAPVSESLSTTTSSKPLLSACSGKSCSSGRFSLHDSLQLFQNDIDLSVSTVSCTSNCDSGPNVLGHSGRVYNNVKYDDVPLISALFQVEGGDEIPNHVLDLLSALIETLTSINTSKDNGEEDDSRSKLAQIGMALTQTPYKYACATAFMNSNSIDLATRALTLCPDHHQGYLLSDLLAENGQPCEAMTALDLWKTNNKRKADNMLKSIIDQNDVSECNI